MLLAFNQHFFFDVDPYPRERASRVFEVVVVCDLILSLILILIFVRAMTTLLCALLIPPELSGCR